MPKVVPLFPVDRGFASDGELPHGSSDVWGKMLFHTDKTHFWKSREEAGRFIYWSMCGLKHEFAVLRNGQNMLFGGGNYPKCKVCMDRLRRKAVRRGTGSY
jgi:hypothetical protein